MRQIPLAVLALALAMLVTPAARASTPEAPLPLPCGLRFPVPPPQDTAGVLTAIEDCVFVDHVDPIVCPELQPLAGTYPGGLSVGSDGDVSLDGSGFNPLYDCPPYEGIS